MPNKNYLKGVRKEREIVNFARESGLISFRSAGSHSPIDVVVIDIKNKQITFVQCKPDSMSENKKKEIEASMKDLNNQFNVFFFVR